MKLIDADELEYMQIGTNAYVRVEDILSATPVDAVPVRRGRWTRIGHIEHTWLVSKCSICGKQTIDAGMYCTNCGARMDGEHDTGRTE